MERQRIPTVAIAVGDPVAASAADTATRRAGGLPVRARVDDAPAWERLRTADVIVWDGVPFQTIATMLRSIRRQAPRASIVLYPPLRQGLVPAMLAAGRTVGIVGLGQWGSAGDVARLSVLLETRMRTIPERIILAVVQGLFPNLPAGPKQFARVVARTRAQGQACSVDCVARELGRHPDRLRRAWPGLPLPSPRRLLRWITLLHVTYLRDRSGVGWATVARASGMDERTLRRLRHTYLASSSEDIDFARVCLAFAAECRISSERVENVLRSLPATAETGRVVIA